MNIVFILFFTLFSLSSIQSRRKKCLPKNHFWKPYLATGDYPRTAFPVGVPRNYSRTLIARVTVPYKKWSRVVPAQLFNDHVESASMYGDNKTIERYNDGIEVLHVKDVTPYSWIKVEWHICDHHDCPHHDPCDDHPPECPPECEPECPPECVPPPPKPCPPECPTTRPPHRPTTTRPRPTTTRTKRTTTTRPRPKPTTTPPCKRPEKPPCDCKDKIEELCEKLRECCCFVEGGIGWDDDGASQIYMVGRVFDEGKIRIGRTLLRRSRKFGSEIGIHYTSGMISKSRNNGFEVLTYDCDRKRPQCLELYKSVQRSAA